MRPVLNLGDDDDEEDMLNVSGVWKVDEHGNIAHRDGKMVVSEQGLKAEGRDDAAFQMHPKDIFYDDDEELGRGACGIVSRAVHKPTGQRLAIKKVKVVDKAKCNQLMTDIQALIRAQCSPNLVQLFSAFVNKKSELMDLGSLADMKSKMVVDETVPEPILAQMTYQMLVGLKALHEAHQIHRDIKPQNILINSEGWVKLTDFGIAKELDTTAGLAMTFVGTSTYMSPERATGQPYSFNADIWSIGIVVYEMACGVFPFPKSNAFVDLFDKLVNKPEPRLDKDKYSPALCDFIDKTIVKDVNQRWSASALLDHDFIKTKCSKTELVDWLNKVTGKK